MTHEHYNYLQLIKLLKRKIYTTDNKEWLSLIKHGLEESNKLALIKFTNCILSISYHINFENVLRGVL